MLISKYRKLSLILALSLFFFTCSNGQNKTDQSKPEVPLEDPYFVKTVDTISDGGPQSITRNMLQDKRGDYWFATWEGIMHYDGKLFTNVTLREGLRQFHVFSLMEDKSGNIWFGTIRGGMYRYTPGVDGYRPGSKAQFTLFTTNDGLAGNMILCMLEDRSGNIWFGTDAGISCLEKQKPGEILSGDAVKFTNFSTKDGLIGNSINSIAEDKSGKIWFATNNGVSCYNGNTLSSGNNAFTNFNNSDGKPFNNVRSIIADQKGRIWIGGADGLFRYDYQSLKQMTSNFTGYLLEDHAGNLWISAGVPDFPNLSVNPSGRMALYRYNEKDSFVIIKLKEQPDDMQVFGIMEDKDGNIWFGTMQGVCRYDKKFMSDPFPVFTYFRKC